MRRVTLLRFLAFVFLVTQIYFAVHHHATVTSGIGQPSDLTVSGGEGAQLERPTLGAAQDLAPGLYRDASVGGVYYVATGFESMQQGDLQT